MPLGFLQTIQNNCSFLLHWCNTKSYSLMEGKYISCFYEFSLHDFFIYCKCKNENPLLLSDLTS